MERTDPAATAPAWAIPTERAEGAPWLAWLVRLRWVAIVGQVLTLAITSRVIDRPAVVVPGLLAAVMLLVGANAVAVRTLRSGGPVPPETLLAHLLLDVGVLTAFFVAAGGSDNPFLMLYLIHVAMASVMMGPRYAVPLTAFVIAVVAALPSLALPLHLDRHPLGADTLRTAGEIVAFAVTASSVGGFTLGTAATLRRQKQRLLEARERTLMTDRLRAVGTLAAGAAHELNTPLSTMDLRLRRIERRHADDPTQADLDVVRSQLERCIDVVDQLAHGAGDPSASGFRRAPLQSFVREALDLWSKGSPIGVRVRLDEAPIPVELPDVAFTQAFVNLLENAREAQADVGVHDPLEVEVTRDGPLGVVRVVDRGAGLPVADRVGEPFFTTKPHGTGLGVFVARALADGAGGGLAYFRRDGRTVATWTFPERGAQP